jgi:Flp pilus assembly pilin Flp
MEYVGMRIHPTWLAMRRVSAARMADLVWLEARGRGQGFVEYALIILFVALAVFLAVTLLGPTISSIFVNVNSAL